MRHIMQESQRDPALVVERQNSRSIGGEGERVGSTIRWELLPRPCYNYLTVFRLRVVRVG